MSIELKEGFTGGQMEARNEIGETREGRAKKGEQKRQREGETASKNDDRSDLDKRDRWPARAGNQRAGGDVAAMRRKADEGDEERRQQNQRQGQNALRVELQQASRAQRIELQRVRVRRLRARRARIVPAGAQCHLFGAVGRMKQIARGETENETRQPNPEDERAPGNTVCVPTVGGHHFR